jgi:hypothetical protein
MTATWSLLRLSYPSLPTYGCACHALNLLCKDIATLPLFAIVLKEAADVATYFRSHLRQLGMPALEAVADHLNISQKQFEHPVKTRWNSYLACADSVVKSRQVLYRLVTSKEWTTGETESRKKISAIVHDATFWCNLESYISIANPLREALKQLERDYAPLSDVYNTALYLQSSFNSVTSQRDECLVFLRRRLKFFLHPCHVAAYLLDHRYATVSTYKTSDANQLLMRVASCMAATPDVDALTADIAAYQDALGAYPAGTSEDAMHWFSKTRKSPPATMVVNIEG